MGVDPLSVYFFRPIGASGTTDKDFVLLSLRACTPKWFYRTMGFVGFGGNLLNQAKRNLW